MTAGRSAFRPDLLEGKVALVTGGGSGIGLGITRALMAHGARAAIVGRKADRLAAAAAALTSETGRECLAAPADVRDGAAVTEVVGAALDRFGALDVVVNGAAGNFLAPAAGLSFNAFRTVVDIDTMGTFNVCKVAFERALSTRGGVIINVSATLHYGATALQAHASAAKAAVDSLTRSLALEWGRFGVRVCGIAPGPIDETEGVARLLPPELRGRLERAIPIGRLGRIDEIASLAVFLASDAASLITGETVVADGGHWLGGRGALALE